MVSGVVYDRKGTRVMRRSLRMLGLWRSVLSMMIEKVSR